MIEGNTIAAVLIEYHDSNPLIWIGCVPGRTCSRMAVEHGSISFYARTPVTELRAPTSSRHLRSRRSARCHDLIYGYWVRQPQDGV